MSSDVETVETTDNSTDWIKNAIAENYFKYYEYKHFSNVKEIGSGSFGKVYCANWKNSHMNFALKSLLNLNNATVKEIVRELKLQREVDFHENIIRFYGITAEIQNDNLRKYFLVMEYANGSTLRNYLKEHFNNLSWDVKFNLALQLAYAVSCLHDEGIVHRNLHSDNVLIHKNTIKLDFGLSKRIEISSSSQSKLFGVIPYSDPKIFSRQKNSNNQIQRYSLNEKSDVYSIGVLLWEISSGQPPFCNEPYDIALAIEILQGLRETPIPNTPEGYINIYTDCWNSEPDRRPTINQVVVKLKKIITKEKCDPNTSERQQSDNLNETNTKEIIEPSVSSSNNFTMIVDEIINVVLENIVMITDDKFGKQIIYNCLNNHNITSQEIYNWLLSNQNISNSIILLGYFNKLGIGTNVNKQKAFELFQKAANLGNSAGTIFSGLCYAYGTETDDVSKKKSFELFQKEANLGNPVGMVCLGYCYDSEIGTSANKQKAFEFVQKAANLGNSLGITYLGCCYEDGIGTDVNKQKAFELYQKAANLGNSMGMVHLGKCYSDGTGTDVNEQKAFELQLKAANLGNLIGRDFCYNKQK